MSAKWSQNDPLNGTKPVTKGSKSQVDVLNSVYKPGKNARARPRDAACPGLSPSPLSNPPRCKAPRTRRAGLCVRRTTQAVRSKAHDRHAVYGQRAPVTRMRTVVCPTPCLCAGERTTTIRDLKLWAYRPRVNKEVTSTERGAAFKAFSLRSRSGMFAIQFFSTAQSSCASHHRCCFQCLSMGLKITEGAPENPQAG